MASHQGRGCRCPCFGAEAHRGSRQCQTVDGKRIPQLKKKWSKTFQFFHLATVGGSRTLHVSKIIIISDDDAHYWVALPWTCKRVHCLWMWQDDNFDGPLVPLLKVCPRNENEWWWWTAHACVNKNKNDGESKTTMVLPSNRNSANIKKETVDRLKPWNHPLLVTHLLTKDECVHSSCWCSSWSQLC